MLKHEEQNTEHHKTTQGQAGQQKERVHNTILQDETTYSAADKSRCC